MSYDEQKDLAREALAAEYRGLYPKDKSIRQRSPSFMKNRVNAKLARPKYIKGVIGLHLTSAQWDWLNSFVGTANSRNAVLRKLISAAMEVEPME